MSVDLIVYVIIYFVMSVFIIIIIIIKLYYLLCRLPCQLCMFILTSCTYYLLKVTTGRVSVFNSLLKEEQLSNLAIVHNTNITFNIVNDFQVLSDIVVLQAYLNKTMIYKKKNFFKLMNYANNSDGDGGLFDFVRALGLKICNFQVYKMWLLVTVGSTDE